MRYWNIIRATGMKASDTDFGAQISANLNFNNLCM